MSDWEESEKLTVVIGTYHQSAAQFDFDLENGTAERKWVDNSASRSVTSIVFNGHVCVFGGNDEVIRIVKPSLRKRVGELMEHRGSLTHLTTFHNTHLLSSSDDGKIYIWKMGASSKKRHFRKQSEKRKKGTLQVDEDGYIANDEVWTLECCMQNTVGKRTRKKLDAEGLEVSSNINFKILSFSVHPSGRLLLSIDNQHELKIWDLIRAKCIVTVKMPVPAIAVQWSHDGNFYGIARPKKLMIYTKEGKLHRVLRPVTQMVDGHFPDRYQQSISCFAFLTKEMVAIADWSARIVLYDVESRNPVCRLSGHDAEDHGDDIGNEEENVGKRSGNQTSKPRICRIKAVHLRLSGETAASVYVVSADNRGRICVWNVQDCLSSIVRANQGFDPLDEELLDGNTDDEGQSEDDLMEQRNGRSKGMDIDEKDNVIDSSDSEDGENEKNIKGTGNVIDSSDIDDDDEDEDEVVDREDIEVLDGDDEEADFVVDENGLCTFESLMQVDTDTHIMCMDAGIMGKENAHYKWKRQKEMTASNGTPVNVDRQVSDFTRKMKPGGLAASTGRLGRDPTAQKRISIQKRRKKKRATKMDFSRFD